MEPSLFLSLDPTLHISAESLTCPSGFIHRRLENLTRKFG